MPSVEALYRYPVKGFTPEIVEQLTVQPDGRVSGDRVLAFRFADAATAQDRDGLDYWPKSGGLSLQDFPALAALTLRLDEEAQRITISHEGSTLVDAGLDGPGRDRLVAAVTDFVMATAEAKRLQRPGRLPLMLVGDGRTSRFQDRARGYVSVHSAASVARLAAAMDADIDGLRFRSNIVVSGVAPEAELEWSGVVRIGDVAFRPEGPIVRCLATHANPATGVRDLRVLNALTQQLGQVEPTLGRLLLPTESGGVIRVGDEVTEPIS